MSKQHSEDEILFYSGEFTHRHQERAYRREQAPAELRQFRLIWLLALFFFLLYAPLDYRWYGGQDAWPLLLWRGLIHLVGVVAVLSTVTPHGQRYRDGISALSLLLVSLCYALLQLQRGVPGSTPGALQLLVVGIYLFSPGRFWLVSGNALFCSVAAPILALQADVSPRSWLDYSYLLPANLLAALVLSRLNAIRRRLYLQNSQLHSEVLARVAAEQRLLQIHTRNLEVLHNTLPVEIADQLAQNPGYRPARHYAEVTVLFADLVGFTSLAGTLPPQQLLRLLNRLFSRFDELAEEYCLEKIKTVGDAYMAAAGLGVEMRDHQSRTAGMALAQLRVGDALARESGLPLRLRIGIHSGPVVGGVIGRKRFAFDIWGETVNVASRLESAAAPGRILVSRATRQTCSPGFLFGPARCLELKGCGTVYASTLYARVSVN